MIVDVVMPKMGESITEGTILEWYKKIGDSIEKDETLLEIGTDKVMQQQKSLTRNTYYLLAKEESFLRERI